MVFDLSKAVRPNILSLRSYQCANRRFTTGIRALLDANENALGPCSEKYAHLDVHRYPENNTSALRERVATFRGVSADQVFVGNGSTEIMDLLIRVFCSPSSQDHILITPPTFEMYSILAQIHDVGIHSVPLTPDFDVDMQATLASVSRNTKVVFICSPGNPTGRSIPNSDIEDIIRRVDNGVVVVDEAYLDFTDSKGAMSLLETHNNLVILQTMSKSFGLAGIRLGMAFTSRDIVNLLDAVKIPYDVNRLTIDAALAALDDITLFHRNIAIIKAQRIHLIQQLEQLPFVIKVYNSEANFVLIKLRQAEVVCDEMIRHGVLTRYRGDQVNCTDCIRITVGTPSENQMFLDTLSLVVNKLRDQHLMGA